MQLLSSTNANRIALTQSSQSTTTIASSNTAKDANPKSYTQNQSVDRPRERPRTCKIRHPLAPCLPEALVLGEVYPWADYLLEIHGAFVRELFRDGEGSASQSPLKKIAGKVNQTTSRRSQTLSCRAGISYCSTNFQAWTRQPIVKEGSAHFCFYSLIFDGAYPRIPRRRTLKNPDYSNTIIL